MDNPSANTPRALIDGFLYYYPFMPHLALCLLGLSRNAKTYNAMDENEEMLYREMNRDDKYYMGDDGYQEPSHTDSAYNYSYNSTSEPYNADGRYKHVPVDPPANGSDAAVHSCMAIAIAFVLALMAFLLL